MFRSSSTMSTVLFNDADSPFNACRPLCRGETVQAQGGRVQNRPDTAIGSRCSKPVLWPLCRTDSYQCGLESLAHRLFRARVSRRPLANGTAGRQASRVASRRLTSPVRGPCAEVRGLRRTEKRANRRLSASIGFYSGGSFEYSQIGSRLSRRGKRQDRRDAAVLVCAAPAITRNCHDKYGINS